MWIDEARPRNRTPVGFTRRTREQISDRRRVHGVSVARMAVWRAARLSQFHRNYLLFRTIDGHKKL
ncbi:hypothetical protein RRSWK_07100 [Rhodopirellula sp. SWK7]|nr:hypothetical protein RRSWK_07100 [Rhodopirellula sp. SWK7]